MNESVKDHRRIFGESGLCKDLIYTNVASEDEINTILKINELSN